MVLSRRWTVTAAAVALVLAVAGCSDDGSSDGASPTGAADAVSCPAPAAAPATAAKRTLTMPDGERSYHLWTPTGYDGSKPVPMVVDYHGTGGESLRYSTTFSGMVRDGLDRGYLVVAPQAANEVWSAPGYPAIADDVAFTKSLIDTVSSTYCVDPNRVYAAGFSLGGGFSNYISCVLDVWAAVAPEGGVNFARACPSRPPMPTIVWHGSNDGIAAYGDDAVTSEEPAVSGENYVGNVPFVMDQWALRNDCKVERVDSVVSPEVKKRTYPCPEGAEVELYVHEGGHTLPGSIPLPPDAIAFRGPQVMSVDAPKVTLDFFDAHQRSTPPATGPVPTDADGLPVG
jgi:polyhydroxybutyrate depolymerase